MKPIVQLTKIVLVWIASYGSLALGETFDISELPIGQNVTLLKPATTTVPLSTRATLGATDMPQILKFEAIASGSEKATPLRIAIYDSNEPRVKYVDLNPGIPFLYSFHDLENIFVIPNPASLGSANIGVPRTKLQIESDKPLMIGR